MGDDKKRAQLTNTINDLLAVGCIPVLNENDTVTIANETAYRFFNDNDELASLVATQLSADLLVLLSDIEGVYERMPEPGHKPVVSCYITRTCTHSDRHPYTQTDRQTDR